MAEEIVLSKVFNYAALDVETRIVVQQRTSEIKDKMRKTAQDVVEIGQKLLDVKDRLGHGRFGEWLAAEFGWTDRTARRFMNVAEQFKSDNLSDLTIAPSALYLLAAPSTPEEAREAVLERARAGEPITYGNAREAVRPAPAVEAEPAEAEIDPYADDEIDPELARRVMAMVGDAVPPGLERVADAARAAGAVKNVDDDDDELTPTERALKVGYAIAEQGEIAPEEAARLTGLSRRGASDMLARAGRVLDQIEAAAAGETRRTTGKCPACRKLPFAYFLNDDGVGYRCGDCGAQVDLGQVSAWGAAALLKCAGCGKPVAPGADFCRHCGEVVGG